MELNYVKWPWRVMEDIVAVLLRASSSSVLYPYLTGRLDLSSHGHQLGQTPRWWLGPGRVWPDHGQHCLLPSQAQPVASSGSSIVFCWASFLMHPSFTSCLVELAVTLQPAFSWHAAAMFLMAPPRELHLADDNTLAGAGPRGLVLWSSPDGKMGLRLRSTPFPNPWPYSVDLINDIWVL